MPADDLPAPHPGAPELAREVPHGAARVVDDLQPGVEPDEPAARADPAVEVPVLGAHERRVVPSDPLERRAAEHPEVDGLCRAGLAARVERGRADARRVRHRPGDGALERGAADGDHHPADDVRARPFHDPHRLPHVADGEHRVAVEPDDDVGVVGRGHRRDPLDREVEPFAAGARRVVDDVDARVARSELVGDLAGPVVRRPDREDDVEGARPGLVEDCVDGGAQVALLVAHDRDRHDVRRRARRVALAPGAPRRAGGSGTGGGGAGPVGAVGRRTGRGELGHHR
ncbi:hypothetical protein GCM10025864_00840 [Luteimicrobium album]|uniref:Uncharacterized protein n=1 Tax=Luteimicrobium album TaxID=1054550 RepID=A0ABQ6HVF5_9MICO|nr:hypothetical protein GCM10025864_00840 [Luteimicrobium album]